MRVLVFGTFDRLHPGHRRLLKSAQGRGDLFVVVARDANVLRLKGYAPEQSEAERSRAIELLFPGASVLLGDTSDFLAPVRSVKPNLILLGYDQRLPPSVSPEDFPCPVQRLPAYRPDIYKSSLRKKRKK